jgi:hypothetical protein
MLWFPGAANPRPAEGIGRPDREALAISAPSDEKEIKVWNGGRASRSAQDCRDQAERLRGLAVKAKSPAVQWDYRELASEWDMMAEEIEMLRRERG